MNGTCTRRPILVGVVLLLMLAAIATDATAMSTIGVGNPLAAKNNNRPLWVAQVKTDEAPRIFRAMGVVTAIEPAGTLTINHEPIQGLMPAMEMTFTVNPRALTKGVRLGDKVEFRVDGKTYTIVELKVRGHSQ